MLAGYRTVLGHVPEHHDDARKVRSILVEFYTGTGRTADAEKYRF
jgi:hypothetical protein